MKYWLNTRWPPRITEAFNYRPSSIYIEDGKEEDAKEVSPDDIVLMYETKTGPTEIRKHLDGSVEEIGREIGREGIISICRVISPVQEEDTPELIHYKKGRPRIWRYYAETDTITSNGFVKRKQVAKILGHKEGYVFRGIGSKRSGLKEITKDEYQDLLHSFKKSSANRIRIRCSKSVSRRPHGVKEGKLHKQIKNSIANNPESVLEEDGLVTIKKEYKFPTNDRIDVLLSDKYNRFVAVEVEPTCEKGDIRGPLQCMKYIFMLAYEYDVPQDEVRCILAATDIHSTTIRQCKKHIVETKKVIL